MGTSAGYDAPPSWGNVKGEVTRVAAEGTFAPARARRLLGDFIRQNGGARRLARGPETTSRGGTIGSGGAAREVARRIGAFTSNVAALGLSEALRREGLSDLIGRPTAELLNGLIDRLGGPSTTIDHTDARAALSALRDKLLADAADAEAVERILTETNANIDQVLRDFFGFYLFEQFCRVFYERLVQRVGDMQAENFLAQIKDFIVSALANRTAGQKIADIDWTGRAGAEIVSDIMQQTLTVFGS